MSEKIPFVSVIIPTHNRRNTLKTTVESLLNQSYSKDHFEIIIVDNASTDGTQNLIESFQRNIPIKLKYYMKSDEGPGISRNFAISKATGSIIAFTEDDCVSDNQWIEKGVSKMVEGVGLVQGMTLPSPHQTRTTFSRTQEILRENGLYHLCNTFYRKAALKQVNELSPDFIGKDCFGRIMMSGEDTDLAWKVKKQGWKSVFADDAVVYHYVFKVNPLKYILSYRKCQLFFYTWPNLIKKHPEIRKNVFYYRVFRTKENAIFTLSLVSMILGLSAHWLFFLLSFPYVVNILTWSFYERSLRTYHRGFMVLIILFSHDLINCILLIGGSIWYRRLVL
jgi:glycosyltransferase involved in cell wall biosynthesis